MKRTLTIALVGCMAAGILTGCSMGMQPAGPDANELKAKEAALPPDQQIQMIQHAPGSAAQKADKIAAIKEKYHMK